MDGNSISEEISSRHNSSEVLDHKCDDNGNNLLNTDEEEAVISIHSINAAN